MKKEEFDRTKMLKIMGLFSSPYEGEVLAAVNRAMSMLDATGTNWDDIVLPETKPKPKTHKAHKPHNPKKTPTDHDYHSLARKIDRRHEFYTLQENQIDFVLDMVYKGCDGISDKQKSWLNFLAKKVGVVPIDESNYE